MKTAKGVITILSDNSVPGHSDTIAEHGFAALVETEEGSFLFDTGKGKTIIYNASILKKDLRKINKIVLSHGHNDHTGGLPDVLLSTGKRDVFAHPSVFAERYRYKETGKEYAGIPYHRAFLEKLGARFNFNREFIEIEKGVYLTGEVPRKTSFERGDMDNRYLIEGGKEIPDLILDDQSLILNATRGIVILAGCAHSGIINILNYTIGITGKDTIFAIVGGTHIGFSGEEQREETIKTLKSFNFRHIIPSHCTGQETVIRLWEEFPRQCQFSYVGTTFEF